MITWLEKSEFDVEIDNFYSANSETERLNSVQICSLSIKPSILRNLTSIEPDDVVLPFTDPGPCLKWYGKSSHMLFVLTHYIGHCDDLTIAWAFLPLDGPRPWRRFSELELPETFIKHIIGMVGYKDAEKSVFSCDEDGLIYEFYRAKDRADAEGLLKYLSENDFPKMTYIAEPERDLAWVAERDGHIVARYPSRYATESYALRESASDDRVITVYAEGGGGTKKVFQGGRRLSI
jgi:hypothetical protein